MIIRNMGWQFFVKANRKRIKERIVRAVLDMQTSCDVIGLGALTKAEWLTHITYAWHAGTMVHAAKGWRHHEVSQVNVKEMEETWQGARELGFYLPEGQEE